MEDFINEIYDNAFILFYLKEYISLTGESRFREARSAYDMAASGIQRLLLKIAPTDPVTANKIQESALKIKQVFDDHSLSTGLVQAELLPGLYDLMKNYTGIEVDSGRYLLKSSNTGFLTAKDNKTGLFLHDTYDPMWQAYQIVKAEYRPQMKTFLIFGCGLGYIPYQIWHQSEGAVKILLFEEDETILEYAVKYGVLSLVPNEVIEIIHDNDPETLARIYIDKTASLDLFDSYYFSPWKKPVYENTLKGELNRLIINRELYSEMKERSIVNLWKNRMVTSVDLNTIADRFQYNEWTVVSAGPSFDENIEFLKMKGRGIIAVNTVLRRLFKEDIFPDIVVAADQYVQMTEHIKGLESYTTDLILIADWLTNWKYIEIFKGSVCFVKTKTNTMTDGYKDIDGPVWDVSGTVACLAIEAAVRMKAKRIYLIGQDLAYPDGKKYAKGMPHEESTNAKWTMQVPSVDGKMVYTCEAFDWFRKAIEYQIRKYKAVDFINLSEHGAYIEGTVSNR